MRAIDGDAIPYTMLYKENWLKGTGVEKPGVWKDTIDAMPTIEPERKTGRWIPQKDKWGDYVTTVDGYVCSECNNFDCMEENYCPNCGARMEGES